MLRYVISFLSLIVLITGCSQTSNPVTPDSDSHNDYLSPIIDLTLSNGDEMPAIGLMGAWELHINPDDMSVDLIAKRSSAIGEAWIISGISYFTMSPCATCLKMTGLELLPNGIVSAKFNIRHPFEPGDLLKPPTAVNRLDLDVFDLALIVSPKNVTSKTFLLTGRNAYPNICVNPDGYTVELSNLIDDQAALPYYLVIDDSITGSSTFNNFEMGASANFDARFDLSAGTVMFDLYLTMGYGASAIRPERLEPKYYNPEFNRNAAWKVKVFAPEPAEEGYTWNDDDPNTTYDVVVHVYDWQQGATVYDNPEDFHNAPKDNIYASSNVASVSVEIPGMTSTLPIETNATSGSGSPDDPLIYNFPIANENLVAAGEYTGLVKVLDERAPSYDFMIENRDYLIHTPDGVTLNEYLMTEYATYQTFTASVVESEIVTEPSGDLVWVRQAGGTGEDHGTSITTLSDNTTVVAGYFGTTAIFGSGEPNETTLTSAGRADIFVARYATDGNLLWAKRAGGSDSDLATAITSRSDDSVVTTGWFTGTAIFGEGDPNETILTSAHSSYRDIFIACYNHDGTIRWASRAGGTNSDAGRSIKVLSDDSVVVTGQFRGTAIFGAGETNQTSLNAPGGNLDYDIFVARYNPDGTLAWAKRAGGTATEEGKAVIALSDDSVIVTGDFRGTATFGPDEANQTILTAVDAADIFIARYNPDGTLAWVKQAGGADNENGRGLATLSDDSVVVTGEFNASVTFGAGEFNETTLTSAGGRDIFIARYDSNGTLQWAKRAGGSATDSGYDVTNLFDDTFVITGLLSMFAAGSVPVTFGEGEPNETTLYTAGYDDIFIARYNPDGTLVWVKRAGGSGRDIGAGITSTDDNYIVSTGYFQSSDASFGEDEPNETTLTSAGSWDMFIAKFEP